MDNSLADKLNDKKILEELAALSENILLHDLINEGLNLIITIQDAFVRLPDFSKIAPTAFSLYSEALKKAEFACLFYLEDNAILSLLEHDVNIPLDYREDYDLYRKINYKLQDIPNLKTRDEFKEKIKNSLLSSRVLISNERISVAGTLRESSVGNWLKDYYAKNGLESVSAFKQSEYLSHDVNIKKLDEEGLSKLKYLVNFVEKMKKSSLDKDGLEESFAAISPSGDLHLIKDGQPQRIDSNILKVFKTIKAKEDLERRGIRDNLSGTPQTESERRNLENAELELSSSLKNYPPTSFEHKVIKQEINRLNKTAASAARQKADAKK